MATQPHPGPSGKLLTVKFQQLLAKVAQNRPSDDLEIIGRFSEFSFMHHAGQLRAAVEQFLIHPLEVALVLADMKLDSTAIAAGLLHDAIEDTPVTNDDVRREFGDHVVHIVEGVTKIEKIDFASHEERQAENVRKMVLAMVDDIRVVLIKLADRLHNMRTLQHLPEERRQHIARETLEIYAPLAHRLGMGKVRGELEDLAFRYVDSIGYDQVRASVESRRKAGESFLAGIVKVLDKKLKENGIEAVVERRIKRLYSIHQKMIRQRIAVDQVYDLLAVRIVTKSVKDCYASLGAIHQMWRPVPGRIKDFIAMPRPNLYQSLHTPVITESGHQFEVQIRTEEMHKMAEDGIAAHWKYKDGSPVSAKDEQRLSWLRQVVEWQQDVKDPSALLASLKVDLYPEEVYTFTPKGKVVILPRDATAIDFAYAIHTEVGHTCVGAKVNGRIVPLRYKLRNGDVVEIMTQPAHNPSRDWLSFTKSSRARNKIRHWLNIHQRERAIEIGKKLIEKQARKYRLAMKDFDEQKLESIAREYGVNSGPDLMAGIGYGKFSARQILGKLAPSISEQTPAEEQPKSSTLGTVIRRVFGQSAETSAIKVKGYNDLLVYRARCCNPIRGEAIVGYVTRGKGVAVHAVSCPNFNNLMYEADRRIAVEWSKPAIMGKIGKQEDGRGTYPVKLTVFCDDRAGMLKQLTAVVSDDNTNIRNIEARTADAQATIDMVIDIEDVKHLKRVINGLRKIPGIHDVQRLNKA